jgi:predicted nucleic acid-binding Zn ribbon protein
MARKSKPKPIGPILESTLKGLEVDSQLKAYSIWGAWRDIVGESLADQTQPRAIRNRILFMDVSHSTWIQQLQFLKPKLLEKINAFFGEPLLQDIRFRMGKITPPCSPRTEDDPWHVETLDEETVRHMESVLQKIGDTDVRESLRGVLIKGAQLERHRKKTR